MSRHYWLCLLTAVDAAEAEGDGLPGAAPAHGAAAAAALHQVDVRRLGGARHEPAQHRN